MKNNLLTPVFAIVLASGSLVLSIETVNADADQPSTVTSIDAFFSSDGLAITPANYPIHETARQFLKIQSEVGVNALKHRRALTPTDNQPVVRMNRDTYYSMALIDVSGGASITVPELPDGKYISIQPVTEDHRIQPMSYGGGTYELATHAGNHLYVIVRLDATFTKEEAASYQNMMKVDAVNASTFTARTVDPESFEAVEDQLKAQMPSILAREAESATFGMFTAPTDESRAFFNQQKYEVGAAIGWGGAQWKDNIYEVSGAYPADRCHTATFENPKNHAFWSITVYDKSGFMFNDLANVSSNTATQNEDGTYTVSFGCGTDAVNNIPSANDSGVITLAVRHYVPSVLVRDQGFRVLPTVKAAP